MLANEEPAPLLTRLLLGLAEPRNEADQCLVALLSMFPELHQVDGEQNTFSLHTDVYGDDEFQFVFQSEDGLEKKSFSTKYVEGFRFYFTLPMTKDSIHFGSSFDTDPSPFAPLYALVNSVIDTAIADGREDFVALDVCEFVVLELTRYYVKSLARRRVFCTRDAKEYAQWEKMRWAVLAKRMRASKAICSICLEMKTTEQCAVFNCAHFLCVECLRYLAEATIGNGDVKNFLCPECPYEAEEKNLAQMAVRDLKEYLFRPRKMLMPNVKLVKYIGVKLLSKYHRLMRHDSFLTFQLYHPAMCSQCPRCDKWEFRENLMHLTIMCSFCKHKYCFECKQKWHDIMIGESSCTAGVLVPLVDIKTYYSTKTPNSLKKALLEKYGRLALKTSRDDIVTSRRLEEMVRSRSDRLVRCPGCHVIAEKMDGCNKMTCKICGDCFCFLCSEMLVREAPYAHFNDERSHCYNRLFDGIEAR